MDTFSVICLIQQENKQCYIVLYISSKSLYLKNLIWFLKNENDFLDLA